jgi:tetratricopeptide (TPR) repeat protein
MQWKKYLLWLSFYSLAPVALGQSIDGAISQFESGQTKPAFEFLTKYLNNNPQDPLAVFYLARVEPRGENSQAFLKDALSLLKEGSESELAQIFLAQQQYSNGLYVTAIDMLNRLKRESPRSDYLPQIQYLLGSSYLATEQVSIAHQQLQSLLESYPSSDLAAWAQLGLGDCHYVSGNFPSAGVEYQRVLDRHGSSPAAALALAQLCRVYSEAKDQSKTYLYYNLLAEKYPAGAIFPEAPLGEATTRPGAEKIVNVTYTVQLGVFGNRSSVENLTSSLKAKEYQPYTAPKVVNKKTYTVVFVGTYGSLEEAKRVKEKLEKELGGSYRVVMKE